MGCGGSKDKKGEDSDVPAAAPTKQAADKPAAAAAAPKGADDREDKSQTWISDDLQMLMQDYFNRYDLDGSQTINSSEELKQLCTNLVVKLDLPMDVSDIDRVVGAAGKFEDDEDGGKEKGYNNWNLQQFCDWFVPKDHFNVDRNWTSGDQSDEDEEPTDEKPFLQGTYVGELGGGGKNYTVKHRVGGKMNQSTGKMEGHTLQEETLFMFKIRFEDDTKLMSRMGCDAVGYHKTSGSVDGHKIQMVVEYDVDNDAATKEPKLVLDGEWGGADDNMTIKGTWKNENAEDPAAAEAMKWLGLEGVQEGEFKLTKRIREDE